jgi:hypothetical protein
MNHGNSELAGSIEPRVVRPTVAVLIRPPKDEVDKFKEYLPWRGDISSFLVQCLEEFNRLTEGNKSPSQLTTEAVNNVVRQRY